MAGYYYLVATLTEYSLTGDSKQLDFSVIRSEIVENISNKDGKLLSLLLSYWDIQNFLNALDQRENQYSIMGNYSKEEIALIKEHYDELVRFSKLSDDEKDAYMDQDHKPFDVVVSDLFGGLFAALKSQQFAKRNNIDIYASAANTLFERYYNSLDNSGSKFLRAWGEFDRTLKNVAAGYEARRKGESVDSYLIGGGEVCEFIKNNQKDEDFSLNEIEWIADLLKVINNKDILKKERGMDMLRWQKIDDLTNSQYFSMDFILAYVVKITMISRWLLLDEKTGREMFRSLVDNITTSSLITLEE